MPPIIEAGLRPPPPAAVPPLASRDLSLLEFLQAASDVGESDAAEITRITRISVRKAVAKPDAMAGDSAVWAQLLAPVQDFGAGVRRAGAPAQDLTARSQETVKTSQTAAEAATARAELHQTREEARIAATRAQAQSAEERARRRSAPRWRRCGPSMLKPGLSASPTRSEPFW
ncbi:hypothetical protein [uncultured Methylobacterium sp.]|uniref:hypothetical protein n=1 Tax=uncultured Methylobacterium sp. TaxID=157278 RepID=UPI00259A2ADF|nr:hypothetical protein [uncultured Methylobacterium sp.]